MTKDILLPEISETVESGDVIEIFVKKGDRVEPEQPLVQLETEKATFDVPSPEKGVIVEILIEQGQNVKVGQPLFKLETDAAQSPQSAAPAPQTPQAKPAQAAPPPPQESAPAAPSEKPALSEKPKTAAPFDERGGAAVAERALPDFSAWGPVERKAVSTTRKKIASTLSYTWATVPQVTQYGHADITTLEQFRKGCQPRVQEAGGKLTLTAIVLKAVAAALHEFPLFNASFDAAAAEIVYKQYCHLSVAVDTDRGLLVPTIRDVDKKSLLEVAVELTALAERTQQHKVTPEEMVGGTFTVSNLGGLGGGAFAPIIYWPQAAILGVGCAAERAVVVDHTIQPRLIVPLSLSYDHRMIDGADGVRFLRRIVEILENPLLLSLE